ncbi:MAG: phosphotyrosine protein phosphatase [Micromonosporaceae bacterium]|nr:phosphotyrosine protein phosphatase [Micromonosporaceae bacterium]
MGNICRSPMMERLLTARAREALGEHADRVDELLFSHSTGTGGWHVGDLMNRPAARQLLARGADADGFAARRLVAAHVDASDLILTATTEQSAHVRSLRPDAAPRTFVLGELRRFLPQVSSGESRDTSGAAPGGLAGLPPFAPTLAAVHARGVTLVELLDRLRNGGDPQPYDDLADPWGMSEAVFSEVADQIDAAVRPLADALLSGRSPWRR